MVVVALMVVGGIVLATVVAVLVMRAAGQEVNRVEAHLHEPGLRTVTYTVPAGLDPALLLAALTHAGYRAIEERPDQLLIECPDERDPEKVRLLLDHACG